MVITWTQNIQFIYMLKMFKKHETIMDPII